MTPRLTIASYGSSGRCAKKCSRRISHGQVLLVDDPLDEPARLLGDGQRGDAQPVPAAVLDEGTPAAADVEDPGARAHVDRGQRVVELAGDAVLERLVGVLEHALGVRAVPAVEEGQVEVRVVLVVVRDVVVVAAHLTAQQRAGVPRDVLPRVEVGEDRTQGEQVGQVALGVEVAVEVGLADPDHVEAAQRVQSLLGADHQGRAGLALTDHRLAAVEETDGERRRTARGGVPLADLGDDAVRGRLSPAE